MENKNKKIELPRWNIVCLIVGSFLTAIGIILFVMAFNNTYLVDWLEILGPAIGGVTLTSGVIMLFVSLKPIVEILSLQREHYTQDITMDIQEDIASKDADIIGRRIRKNINVRQQAIHGKKICHFCGAKLNGDENYCTKCGQLLYKKCSCCNFMNSSDNKYCVKCGKKL